MKKYYIQFTPEDIVQNLEKRVSDNDPEVKWKCLCHNLNSANGTYLQNASQILIGYEDFKEYNHIIDDLSEGSKKLETTTRKLLRSFMNQDCIDTIVQNNYDTEQVKENKSQNPSYLAAEYYNELSHVASILPIISDMIAEKDIDDGQEKVLSMIESQIESLIYRNNSTFSPDFQPEKYLLKEELTSFKEQNIDMFYLQNEIQIDKEIHYELETEEDLFHFIVEPLLWNVFNHAFPKTKESSKRKSATVTGGPNENEYEIIVTDNGIGIPKECINKIFDENYSTKENHSYVDGVGLFSVKEILRDNFNGNIRVDSEYGRGTKFTVTLPISSCDSNNYRCKQ